MTLTWGCNWQIWTSFFLSFIEFGTCRDPMLYREQFSNLGVDFSSRPIYYLIKDNIIANELSSRSII